MPSTPPSCVAIPVRNEAERIGGCLRALSEQNGPAPDRVVLLVNNTTDETLSVVDQVRPDLRFPVECVVRNFGEPGAHAGRARAEAMEIAAGYVGPNGLLLTTDADGKVAPNWLSATLAALASRIDCVCGRAEIDPVEAQAIPAHLHRDDAEEVAYATVLDHIHALVDPDPFDPWPRHTEHSGASIAVRVAAWAAASGVPPLANGEDRAFLEALRRADRTVRHALDVRVVVSGRVVGRASGGMADTMARRMIRQDHLLDAMLEPAIVALHRARARASLRLLHAGARSWAIDAAYARQVGLPLATVTAMVGCARFGEAWALIEAASPRLRRQPVRREALPLQHDIATRIVDRLLQRRGTGDMERCVADADGFTETPTFIADGAQAPAGSTLSRIPLR